MHILCELRESHAITAQKLREAGQDVHRQIAPPQKLFILDEIYEVREIEELYLSGKISTFGLLMNHSVASGLSLITKQAVIL